MKLKKFGTTEQRVYLIAAPIAERFGCVIWDVRYEKEGAQWYLRVFIDKVDEPVSIDDCEHITTPLSDALDAEDPIPQSYILEVSSAGLEANLVRESHFDACEGCTVRVRGIRPLRDDGERELIGTLLRREEDAILLETENETLTLPLSALAFVRLYFDFDALEEKEAGET